MRRLFVIILTVLFAVGVCGCDIFTSKPSSDKHLTTYFGAGHDVVAARFFVYPPDAEDYVVSYITVDQLDDLIGAMDETPLIKHMGHTDYFYRGEYGIELELDDGTYLTYDGTALSHTRAPFDAEYSSDDTIERAYLEDANKDFWDRMEEFFPELEEYGEYVGYGW